MVCYNTSMENASTINAFVDLPYRRGFHIAFANGYTVSVQFGTGNYCDVRDYAPKSKQDPDPPGCSTVEIGIFKTVGGEWVKLTEHDDVAGWVSVDKIPEILTYAQNGHWNLLRSAIGQWYDDAENAEIAKAAELDM